MPGPPCKTHLSGSSSRDQLCISPVRISCTTRSMTRLRKRCCCALQMRRPSSAVLVSNSDSHACTASTVAAAPRGRVDASRCAGCCFQLRLGHAPRVYRAVYVELLLTIRNWVSTTVSPNFSRRCSKTTCVRGLHSPLPELVWRLFIRRTRT